MGISMKKYAIFVAATDNYLMYLNALLNSIVKRELYKSVDLTVYLMHYQFPIDYCKKATEKLPFKFIPLEIKKSAIEHPQETKRIEFVKRARFKYTVDYGMDYDAICLLDADMFIVSDQFIKRVCFKPGGNKQFHIWNR